MSNSKLPPEPGASPRGRTKYWHYLFVTSIFVMSLCILALLNSYVHFANVTSYTLGGAETSQFLLATYLGMFLSILLLPIPDYVLVPVYGYLSAIGIFNPLTTFLVCLVGAVIPVEFIPGRYAARPLLLKGLRYFGITENDIGVADRWIGEHGKFSIFISTFIPFFYSVVSLAAGTLRMSFVDFLLSSAAGFGVRYAFLEYIGYKSVFIFTVSFDYSNRGLFSLLLVLSAIYAAVYLVDMGWLRRRVVSAQ